MKGNKYTSLFGWIGPVCCDSDQIGSPEFNGNNCPSTI